MLCRHEDRGAVKPRVTLKSLFMGVTDVAAVARGDTDSETGGVDRQVVSCGSAAGGRHWVWSTMGGTE